MSVLSKKLNLEAKEKHPVDLRFIINVRETDAKEKQLLSSSVNEVNLEGNKRMLLIWIKQANRWVNLVSII